MRPLPAGEEDEEPLALRARLWTCSAGVVPWDCCPLGSLDLLSCSVRRPYVSRGVTREALFEIAGASCHCIVAQLGSQLFRPLLDVPRKRGIA